MGVMLVAQPLAVTKEQRRELKCIARSSSLPHRTVLQARALLLSADGVSIYETARQVGVASNSVRSWRWRFVVEGIDGVGRIAEGRGRKPWLPDGIVAEVVHVTLHELPGDGSAHWSTRTMANRFRISKDSVARIWRDHELRPWKVEAFTAGERHHPDNGVVFDGRTVVQVM